VCVLCTARQSGLVCDLDRTVDRTCVLQSPLITFNWTCIIVSYELSSDDVKLTADLMVNDISEVNHVLPAKNRLKKIRHEGLGSSSINLQLTASRYLVTSADYEFAFVYSVSFHDWCGQDAENGMWKSLVWA